HAGWGGALGGVLEDTVAKMSQVGTLLETVHACVGPCIQQASYEVSESFADPFLEKHPDSEKFFKSARRAGHLMFDLSGYVAFRLALCGVKNVSLMGADTYAEEARCFSYRRATHRKEPDYGRQISAIVIRKD
ncbi:MAG: laccase domain-containing protein, partial [Micavibrio aeruginosavorus]